MDKTLIVLNIREMIKLSARHMQTLPTSIRNEIDPHKFILHMFNKPRDYIIYRHTADDVIPYYYQEPNRDLVADDLDFLASNLDVVLQQSLESLIGQKVEDSDQYLLLKYKDENHGLFTHVRNIP